MLPNSSFYRQLLPLLTYLTLPPSFCPLLPAFPFPISCKCLLFLPSLLTFLSSRSLICFLPLATPPLTSLPHTFLSSLRQLFHPPPPPPSTSSVLSPRLLPAPHFTYIMTRCYCLLRFIIGGRKE